MSKRIITGILSILLFTGLSMAQDGSGVSYASQQEYEIGGITVGGADHLNEKIIMTLSGLNIGDKVKIPGTEIAKAIKTLWKQGLFSDVAIYKTKTIGGKVFLEIRLQERARLCSYSFRGIKKGEIDDIRDKIRLIRGKVYTENVRINTTNIIQKHFVSKGYLNTKVTIDEDQDTSADNCLKLTIRVDKGNKVKIDQIAFNGVSQIKEAKLKRLMKGTKERAFYKIFNTSRFKASDYEDDKISLVEHYNAIGFRDAVITADTTWMQDEGLQISITIDEGNKYYFRHVTFKGNSRFNTKKLDEVLGIKRGDVYDSELLDTKLYMNPSGLDVSSLYMDDGYLFFNATPVEVSVENDSIDLEIRIYEGAQATIRRVTIEGNTKTNEHVIRRELRTIPGNKFSRTDIIRSQRELINLGYFAQEEMGVVPIPNPQDGTVDIVYTVVEKPADQIEMSMGWGGIGLVGSLGVSFTNFSMKNILNGEAWQPLPAGDGQRLTLRYSANARFFNSLNFSFTEPWMGGRKPNAFTVSAYSSKQSNGLSSTHEDYAKLTTTGGSIGLGIRLPWPDDFFVLQSFINVQRFDIKNWFLSSFTFNDGESYNVSLRETIARNSIDAPVYPRRGSNISLAVHATLPYSLFNNIDYATATDQEKYKWIEYHKWLANFEWYTTLSSRRSKTQANDFGTPGKLVLKTQAKFGFLGFYNRQLGHSPFERFQVGGNGLTNFALYGVDVIASRGYDENGPNAVQADGIGTIYNKYTMEIRYPFSLQPMSTIYGMAFAEGVNAWDNFRQFNPYEVKRTVGLGLRVFLPMFGLLGFDYGIGIDRTENGQPIWSDPNRSFMQKVGASGQLRIILGFEPQ
jgi:outer membrane protein insertion porin family